MTFPVHHVSNPKKGCSLPAMERNHQRTDVENITDEELVARIVQVNDTYWFGILYDRYARIVYYKCLSFTKSVEEAQDLTHDIFVLLFAKLKTFRGQSRFSTWLYSFVYNFCVNYMQRNLNKYRQVFVPTEDFTSEMAEIEDEVIFELKEETLKNAMEDIDPDDKMILLMKYQDDFSVKDISITLEIGESAAKMRLKRAKHRLMELYNKIN
ncbi:RNA polymerase sigma factor [Sinomicrobium sp. M5D2P17]